jgi:hypothetical protein
VKPGADRPKSATGSALPLTQDGEGGRTNEGAGSGPRHSSRKLW